jgi:hypothetical protein
MSVKFDFDALEAEIKEMEDEKEKEIQKEVESYQNTIKQTINNDKETYSSLPSQAGPSLAFHQAIVQQYQAKNELKPTAKQQFLSRKMKRKNARKAKKASDLDDKNEMRNSRKIRKKKNRRHARNIY